MTPRNANCLVDQLLIGARWNLSQDDGRQVPVMESQSRFPLWFLIRKGHSRGTQPTHSHLWFHFLNCPRLDIATPNLRNWALTRAMIKLLRGRVWTELTRLLHTGARNCVETSLGAQPSALKKISASCFMDRLQKPKPLRQVVILFLAKGFRG